jgi:hypothetical protein
MQAHITAKGPALGREVGRLREVWMDVHEHLDCFLIYVAIGLIVTV